jgi:Spy/CpxP family protein refolding chaperone
MTMNVQRSLWLALPLALLFAVGCNDAAPTGQTAEPVAAAPAAAAPVAETGHRHGRHHFQGPARMLFRAARSLDLGDAQKATIQQLAQQLRGERGQRGEQGAARTALIEGVRAGSVDLARVESLQTASGQARQARREREATALNGLWAALQPDQRAAVVATVRERQAARAARWAAKKQEARAPGEWQANKLARLTNQLGLDTAQQSNVQALLAQGDHPTAAAMHAQHAQMKERNEALLTAFAGDAFDANKLDLSPAFAGKAAFGQHRAQFLAQLVPILRADQREKLASSMESERL